MQAFDKAAIELDPTLDPKFAKAVIQLKRQTPDELAARARVSWAKGIRSFKAGLRHWADCGRSLAAAKELVEHGGWNGWLASNWEQTPRQARNLMKIARHESWLLGLADQAPEHFTQGNALRVIAEVGKLPIEELADLEDPSWDTLGEVGIDFKPKAPTSRQIEPRQLPLDFYRDKLRTMAQLIQDEAAADLNPAELAELLRASRIAFAGIESALTEDSNNGE